MHKLFLTIKNKKYIGQSLTYYGILIQNNKINYVTSHGPKEIPFININEGILCSPALNKIINNTSNIEIYKNNLLVIEKKSNTEDTIAIVNDNDVFDLYNEIDNLNIIDIINHWENTQKIYLHNTEEFPSGITSKKIAGLASGTGIAKISYENKMSDVYFYDYKHMSLDFQKQLINSNNRKEIFYNFYDYLTLGDKDISINDIENIDYDKIDNIYNFLRTINVRFFEIDMRNKSSISLLIEKIDPDTTLWISNVFHYITSLDYYDYNRYILLDKLCQEKNINLLPYTRIYYEG